MAIQLIQGFQSKTSLKKCKHSYLPLNTNDIDLHGHTYLIIKLPHSRVLNNPRYSRVLMLLARAMLLALLFATTFSMTRTTFVASTVLHAPTHLQYQSGYSNSINDKVLSLLLYDLRNEGLLKNGDKAIFVMRNGDKDDDDDDDPNGISNAQILIDSNMDLISASNLDRQSTIPEESVDFAITTGFHIAQEFIDRTLKVGGIAVVQLSDDPSFVFNKPSNYKVVYFRRFQSTILAMRKTGTNDSNSTAQRRLLGFATEEKKAALSKLEDVLLEPPRAASGKSSRYLKKTRYLPDIMGDSLQSYPRRVFIDVGLPEKKGGSGTGWFARNYPTRNLDFEMYKIETVTEQVSGKEVLPQLGMSDWLRKNVKEEEYVVMKAEAEVVEEMVKSKAIRLVDELFMECKSQGHGGNVGSKRAYWECLALYGRLRDEGVAVHQWWG